MSIPSHLIEAARQSNILDVALQHGAVLKRVGSTEWAGACLRCGGRDRFGLSTKKQLFNCRGCGASGDVISLVRHLGGCTFSQAIERLTGHGTEARQRPSATGEKQGARAGAGALPEAPEAERARAQWLWRQRRPIGGSVAEIYLRRARGYGGAIPATLAFLPARGDHAPALIAAFGIATEPEPGALAIADADVRAVQLVKLKPDGTGKADVEPKKIIIGRGALGSPIACAPPNDLLGLAICEGLENALSVHEATCLGAWASGPAGRMPALANAVPGYINFVTIAADYDRDGLRYAHALSQALDKRGIKNGIPPLGERVR